MSDILFPPKMLPHRLRDLTSSDASPSVSMERGTYRMRAPKSLKPLNPLSFDKRVEHDKPTRYRNRQQDLLNRNFTLLLVVLTLGSIGCFGVAYYLFSTRWALISGQHSSTLADAWPEAPVLLERIDVARYIKHSAPLGERFLAYLPHSGFHNQRIAFENALLLARLLNRTLLAPPVYLSARPTRYQEFGTLFQSLALSGREGLQHCSRIPKYLSTPIECLHYFDSTTLPWNTLFDLSIIESSQPIIYLQDVSQIASIHASLPTEMVQTIRDETSYHFRLRDDDNGSFVVASKYEEDIFIPHLAQSPFPVLQFGSLFGSHRLLLQPSHERLQQDIRSQMVFGQKSLIQAADLIKHSLFGAYLGIHLRLGDGQFLKNRDTTVIKVWCSLLQTLGYTPVDIQHLIHHNNIQFDTANITEPCPLDFQKKSIPEQLFQPSTSQPSRCSSPHGAGRRFSASNLPLYISTDLKDPRLDPLLHPILKTFPCSFFLADFPEEIDLIRYLRSPTDGVDLYPFFLPFLDAMVVAKAALVIGTAGSTFSRYVEATLWPSYHTF